MASTLSDQDGEIRPVVLLGASGRLGRMLRGLWPGATPPVAQARGAGAGEVTLDPLADPGGTVAALDGAGTVICLWGVTPARAAREGCALSLNVELARAALDAAPAAGAGRVLLASSAAVYGAAEGPLREDAACQPASDYGRAKLEMEALAARHPHPATCLRIGNVAGADAILGGWRAGMALDTLADGRTPRRSYIGPASLARVMHALCGHDDLPDTLNVAAPGTVEMGALLDAAGLAWAPRPAGPDTIAEVALDTARLERLTAFAPEEGTPEGIVAQWRAHESRP